MKNEKTTSNPFENLTATNSEASGRKLSFTTVLNERAGQRAYEIMTAKCNTPELRNLANTMLDGDPNVLVELINACFGAETINADASVLDGCDDEQLKKLLESRRSERSVAKRKGPRSNAVICRSYIASMYAELMLRVKLNAPYTGANTSKELNEADMDAVAKRIKSLQSKKCRLKKLAEFDAESQKELADTTAEIERLSAFRPATREHTKTIVKGTDLDAIRSALSMVDASKLSAEEQTRLEDLMRKIG